MSIEPASPVEVFAFVALRPCGCVCQAATPRALGDMMKNKHFREQMNAGKIRAVVSRDEWMSLPWECEQCKEKPKVNRKVRR